ncbi:hypothetical protein HNP84_009722 [Thermocatellispora tengchongensis]|uniref:Uncharacterized protein n=1 Tax=Thermocatellispora tengchongensis TaxID=1073253 RepID=A0A840PS59_9ACTN|nr:hypothetical protein [Thermocatellispora tengchongensis]MBB5139957.1 hypothetical protein [Thermocatellispora tengchongensis]
MHRRKLYTLLVAAAAAIPFGLAIWMVLNRIEHAVLVATPIALLSYGLASSILEGSERLRQAEEDPVEVLRRRIRRVNRAFDEAATLMQELQRDFAAQEAARDALIAQAEEQRQVLSVSKEDAEKIRKILTGETKETIRAELRREWGFFLAGVLVSAALSIPIGIWVNSIS